MLIKGFPHPLPGVVRNIPGKMWEVRLLEPWGPDGEGASQRASFVCWVMPLHLASPVCRLLSDSGQAREV